MTYIEAASADGAWRRWLKVPGVPVGRVRGVLVELARSWPVAAALPGETAEPVTEVMLYRDPSRTYGTPDSAACETRRAQARRNNRMDGTAHL